MFIYIYIVYIYGRVSLNGCAANGCAANGKGVWKPLPKTACQRDVETLAQQGLRNFSKKCNGKVLEGVWKPRPLLAQPKTHFGKQMLRPKSRVSVRTRRVMRLNSGRKGYGNLYPKRYGNLDQGKVWKHFFPRGMETFPKKGMETFSFFTATCYQT